MPDENKLVVIEADQTSRAMAEKPARVMFKEKRSIASEEYKYSWRYLVNNLLYQGPGESVSVIADEKNAVIGIRVKEDNLLHRLSALAEQAKIFEEQNRIVPLFIEEKEYIRELHAVDINKALELPHDHPAYQYAQIHIKKFTPSEEKYKPFYPKEPLAHVVRGVVEMFAGVGWVEETSSVSESTVSESTVSESTVSESMEETSPVSEPPVFESTLTRLHSACRELEIPVLTEKAPPLWTSIRNQIPRILEAARFTKENYGNRPEFKELWEEYVSHNKNLINSCLAFMQKIRPASWPLLQNNWPETDIPLDNNLFNATLETSAREAFIAEAKVDSPASKTTIKFLLECQDAFLFLELDRKIFETLERIIAKPSGVRSNREQHITLINHCIHLIPFLEKNATKCSQKIRPDHNLYFVNPQQNQCFYLFNLLIKHSEQVRNLVGQSSMRSCMWGLLNYSSLDNLKYHDEIYTLVLGVLQHGDEGMVKSFLTQKNFALIKGRFRYSSLYSGDTTDDMFKVKLQLHSGRYKLSIIALASLMNPFICEQLINNIPKESRATDLANALTELNHFHDIFWLEDRSSHEPFKRQKRGDIWHPSRAECWIKFSSETSIQARLTLLLNLEAYPGFKDYQYTKGDKRILQDYMCDVISSIENVEDVCKFYDKQNQYKYWDHRRHAIFDKARSACKSVLFNDPDEGSRLKDIVTQACKQRIQKLRKQDPSAVLSEDTEKHLLFKKDARSHSSNITEKADDLSRRMLLRP